MYKMSHAKPPQRFRSSSSWWTKWDGSNDGTFYVLD